MPCGASVVVGDCARYSDWAAGETLRVATADREGRDRYKRFRGVCLPWVRVTALSGVPASQNFLQVPQVPKNPLLGSPNHAPLLPTSIRAFSGTGKNTLSLRSCCPKSWGWHRYSKGEPGPGHCPDPLSLLGPLVFRERVGGPECSYQGCLK